MAAYWITHVTVSDEAAYGEYARRAGPAITGHGGRFLVRGGAYKQLEGRERPRNVVVVFDTLEAAETCYNSAEYQHALSFARNASERDLVIVEGVAD